MKRSSLVLAVLLPLLVVGGAACGGAGGGNAAPAAAKLSVEGFAFTQLEGGKRVFTGDIYNPTSEPVQNVRIGVSLLDTENRQVGTTTINVSEVAAQDTTSFRQVFDSGQDVSGAKMTSLTTM